MSQVFYRKYRPKKFEEVIGQGHIVGVLKNAVFKNRISHAYLFAGPRGTGKTTIARILAKEVGCAEEDIIEIDAASSRGIDEAKALREAARTVPFKSPYKTYIIDEAHMLTKEAFNVLLKTIEEPPAHVIFVLATTEFEKIPDTIVSRAQYFKFNKISIADIMRELQMIAEAEGLKAHDDALKLIAFFAEGSLRDAENIMFQVFGAEEKEIREELVRTLLGAPEEETVNNLILLSLKKEVGKMLEVLDKNLATGGDHVMLGKLILRNLRAAYFLALDKNAGILIADEFSQDEIASLKTFSAYGAKTLEEGVRMLYEALRLRADDFTASLPLELALIKIATRS